MRIAEVGSGSGRIVNMLLDAGAASVVAVEPSEVVAKLKQNTEARRDRVHIQNTSGDQLPAGQGLDLVVATGVLLHISSARGPWSARPTNALRPGGKVLIWLYDVEAMAVEKRIEQNSSARKCALWIANRSRNPVASLSELKQIYPSLRQCNSKPWPGNRPSGRPRIPLPGSWRAWRSARPAAGRRRFWPSASFIGRLASVPATRRRGRPRVPPP